MSVEDILDNKDVDIILNLTNPIAHYQTIKDTLNSGKHSYCEKPLSITFEQGEELFNLANSKKLYLGNAPDTFLGGGGQLTKNIIELVALKINENSAPPSKAIVKIAQ